MAFRGEFLGRGFELPEDDLPSSHQLPEKGPTTLAGVHANSAGFSVRWQNAIWRFESSQPRHGFVDLVTGIGVTKCRGGMRGNSGSFLTLASLHAICERGAVDFAQSSNCRHGLYVLNWTFKLRRQPYSTWYRGSFWSFRQLILMTAVATHLVANAAHGHAAARERRIKVAGRGWLSAPQIENVIGNLFLPDDRKILGIDRSALRAYETTPWLG
jgi:hypothetical protein